jgi:hypothetical protein
VSSRIVGGVVSARDEWSQCWAHGCRRVRSQKGGYRGQLELELTIVGSLMSAEEGVTFDRVAKFYVEHVVVSGFVGENDQAASRSGCEKFVRLDRKEWRRSIGWPLFPKFVRVVRMEGDLDWLVVEQH